MSEWPEPTPEPGEPPRWIGWGVLAVVISAALWATSEDRGAPLFAGWRLPEISLPEIEWPDLGADEQGVPQSASTQESIEAAIPGLSGANDFSAPLVQSASFDTCVETAANAANTLGPPIMLEDTADRRVVRFKLLDGDVTITCAGADQTLIIERRGG